MSLKVFFLQIRCNKLLLVCLFLLSLSRLLPAQSYPFREYGVSDGLPQSQSSGMFVDSRGFIWINTRNGLSRFDGIEFINYFRKNGLPTNFINSIIEDSQGIIWAISNDGISRFNGNEFVFFPPPPQFENCVFSYGSAKDSNNYIYLIVKRPDNTVPRLLQFKDGIYSDYSSKYKALDTLRIEQCLLDLPRNEMLLVDNSSQMWIWSNENLIKLSMDSVIGMFHDRGKLIVVRNDVRYEYSNGDFLPLPFINSTGRPEALVSLVSEVINIDYFNGSFESHVHLPFASTGVIVDSEGVLWTVSEKNVNRLLSTAFTSFSEDELLTRNIWAIAEDKKGHIWFGSLYGTLIEYDGNEFIKRDEYKTLFKKAAGFYKGSRKMANGDLWLSTNMGVLIWDGKSFSRLKGIPEETQICYIYEDCDNKTVMLGTEKGLFILKDQKTSLISEFGDIGLAVIEGVTKDDEGIYWLSSHKGVIRYDGENTTSVREVILPQAYTYTIEKDSFGGIWVTSDEGLFFKGKSSVSFIHGLPEALNTSANSICLMDSTHIIVGRVSDICIIDLEKFYIDEESYFRMYDKSDGFQGGDCLDNGIIKDIKGNYWILTSDKVVILEPDKLENNPFPPKLYITGLSYQTDSLTWKPVDKSQLFYQIPDIIELRRYQNSIRITFTGISTTNPEKVKYQNRLIGFDSKWTLPSNIRFVSYERLTPGQYSFQLKAFNSDGVETADPLVVNFRILPAFWQTVLFKIFSVLLSLISTVLLTLATMKRIQRKRKEKEEIKSQLSRLQMSSVLRQFDPHFTFNVISSVGSLIMKGEKEIAYDFITKLSGLLRTVLTDGSLIIRPLSDELDFVNRYCELQSLRFKKRFSYNIEVADNVDLIREIPKMTIQTFVENSIKHGIESRKEGGNIAVFVNCYQGTLEIRIKDNGIGRVAAARQNTDGTGYGLKILEGIFDVMNVNNRSKATIAIIDLQNNEIPSGTEVIITIPDDYRFEFDKNKSKKLYHLL